jgi:hypothetical protein
MRAPRRGEGDNCCQQALLEDQPGNRPPRTVTGQVKLKPPPGAFALVTLKNVYG